MCVRSFLSCFNLKSNNSSTCPLALSLSLFLVVRNSFLLTQPVPVPIELPTQWLWDMIDEFVSQFQSFRHFYSASYKSFTVQELQILKENSRVWNAGDVMFYLNELINKASILPALAAEHRSASHDEIRQIQGAFGSKSIYRMLGYFAIIGLSRVHCLLGDYFMTLKNLDPLEVNQKRFYTRSTSFQISLYYHLGFAYLMCRRYPDAIKAFSTVLLSISRSRGAQQSRTALGDQVAAAADRINALLAIAITLCPQRLDESINTSLWDSYGERIVRMQRGESAVFSELFELAAPSFVYGSNVNPAVTAAPAAASEESEAAAVDGKSRAFRTQQRLFLNEVSQQILIPTIRSYLKLYTTIDVAKLAHFLDIDVKQVIQHMISFKHKAQTKRWQTTSTPAQPQPQPLATGDLRFFFQQDMVHISSDKGPRRYSTYYIRQISKFDEILQDLKTKRDVTPAPGLLTE